MKQDLTKVPQTYKTLCKNPWISLCETKESGFPYVFAKEERCKFGVSTILPFRIKNLTEAYGVRTQITYEYLGHYEERPCHAIGPQLYSFTGGIDENETPEQCAIRELLEESGYRLKETALINLGVVRPHKAMDTVNYLYAVDLTNVVQEDLHHDGSVLEQKSYNRWVAESELIGSVDPLVHAMYMRWKHASE